MSEDNVSEETPTDHSKNTIAGTGRREVLRTFGAAGALTALGASDVGTSTAQPTHQGPFSGDPFTLGVASGDPLPDSVVLWTRLAPKPLKGDGGMPDRQVSVQWKIATDKKNGKVQHVVQAGTAYARPEFAHSVHVDVQGLEPDTEYFYQFKAGPDRSRVGRTQTAPAPNESVDELTFTFASCQNYAAGHYTAYQNMVEEDLDFVLHLGDYIYEGGGQHSLGRGHEPPREIESLADYRIRYAQYKSDPNLKDAHAAFPWLVTWDDHEVENNYADEISQANDPPQEFLERRADAYQAYFEHQPLRPSRMPDGHDLPLHRRFKFGELAEINLLDTRQHRSDQVGSSEAAQDPDRTILGHEQEDWLVEGLEESDSRWNVLANQVPMAATDENPDPDVQNFGGGDKWDGYRADRQALLEVMAENADLNPVVVTGDVHSNFVYNLKADFTDPDSETVGTEYVGTSISSNGDGSGTTLFGPSGGEPWRRFFNDNRGYVRCTLTPEEWQADYQVVSTVEEPEASVNTVASFVTEAGSPGAALDGVALSDTETEAMYLGNENPVAATLINPTAEKIEFEVSIEVPEGWCSENSSISTVLPPSSSEIVELSVTPLESLGLDDEEYIRDTLRVTLAAEGADVYGSPREVEVLVVPEPEGSNLALSAQTSASSTLPGFPTSRVVDGNKSSTNWVETAWVDATSVEFPDTFELQFNESQSIGRVDLYTIGSGQFPASQWGLRDWDVQLFFDGGWQTVREVRDNEDNPVISTFEAIETDAVRIRALSSNNGVTSPIVELEVYAG